MKHFYRAFYRCCLLLFFSLLLGCSKNAKVDPDDDIPEPSANPDWVLIDTAGSVEGYDSGEEIAIDAAGNVYVVGSIAGTAKFGAITKSTGGGNNCFITKYNSKGALEWVQTVEVMGASGGIGIAVDSKGYLYVLGGFTGTAKFGSISKTSSFAGETFIAKYDTNGNIQWVQTIIGETTSGNIAIDKNDNLYVCGYFSGTAKFGGISKTTALNTYGQRTTHIYVAKYNSEGVVQKLETTGGESNAVCKGIAIDDKGNIYITGYFQGTINFQGISKADQGMYSNNLFVAKYNASFDIQWVQTALGPYLILGSSIGVDKNENVYVSGILNGKGNFGNIEKQTIGDDLFVTKLDKSGNYQWVQTIIGSYLNSEDLSLDGKGNVYVTGDFSGETNFGTISKTSAGSYDVFVAKYDQNGTSQWVKTAGVRFSDSGKGIVSDVKGNLYVTGHFGETVNFGAVTKTSAGAWDIFTAKIQ